jgi:N-acetyl sugar amidotransferase
MRMIKYCTRCIYPDTKPDLWFDEQGVCSSCKTYEKRGDIDWDDRRQQFLEIIEKYRDKTAYRHDCIVPVSGGKDSTFQVIKVLQLGLNPLCVIAMTDSLSDIGRRNIENIKNLGVDCLEVTTNPVIRRKINKLTLFQVGDISWAEHITIYTIPVRVAVQQRIPLIIWGENPQNEYGGPAGSENNPVVDRKWLEEFGGLLGLRVTDLPGQSEIEDKHLINYRYPSDEELDDVEVSALFLGYFFPWEGHNNNLLAQSYGFESWGNVVEGHMLDYENLDNLQAGIHEYFMYLKFGFGRATAQASMQIRRGRMTREDAVEVVKRCEGRFPSAYLGQKLETILAEIDVDTEEFTNLCDQYTNRQIFRCDNADKLIKDSTGSLIKTNYDN